MIPEAIVTKMSILKLIIQRKAPRLTPRSLKASRSDCIPGPEGWAEEGRDDSSLPARVGFYFVPIEMQATHVSHVWQELPQPAYLLLAVLNHTIMARLFINTLKGVAFDWFRSLPSGSINSWIDLETRFLSWFYEDNTEVTIDKLLSTVQKGRESVRAYI